MITNVLLYEYNIERGNMYNVIFYEDRRGESEVKEYLKKLRNKKDKESKIKLSKITAYLDMLVKQGCNIGEPYIKHLEDEIWELRPLRDRILFAYFDNNEFILLNIFMKKTQKTPKTEINKAKRNLRDYIERRKEYEKENF